MANHASAKKRIRSSAKKRVLNRYKKKSCVTFIKKLALMTDKAQATPMLRKVIGMIDRLTNKHIIHLNKSSRLKAQLTKRVNAL